MGLVIGKLQEQLVKKFTAIETITLTLWFYTALAGSAMIATGVAVSSSLEIIAGIITSIISASILYVGLHKEHDIATESGNAGPNA